MNYIVSLQGRKSAFKIVLAGIITLMLGFIPVSAMGAERSPRNTFQRIDASYIIGGQIYNDNFIYNPGLSLNMTYGIYLTSDVSIGFGAGYQSFENERFIPIYGEILGYKKHKNTSAPFIRMQMGYGIGWSENFPANIHYKYSGGPFIDIGMGRKFKINDRHSLIMQWSYRHQFARLEYETYGAEMYSQNLNYDMIVITIAFMTDY